MAKQSQGGAPDPNAWPSPLPKTVMYLFISMLVGATWGVGLNTFDDNIGDIAWSLKGSELQATYLLPMYIAPYIVGLILFFKFRSQFGMIAFARTGITAYWALDLCHMFIQTVPQGMVLRALTGACNGFMSPIAVLYAMEVLPISKRMPWGYVFGLSLASPMVIGMKAFSFDLEQSYEFLNGMFTFEIGLATLSLALVWYFSLTPSPTKRAFDWVDAFSYPLALMGILSFCIFILLGRSYWWFDYHFMGYVAMISVISLSLFVIIENARKRPMMKIAYLLDSRLLLFAAMLLGYRLLMASQNVIFGNVMSANGYGSRQLTGIYFWVFLAEALGMFFVGFMYVNRKIIYFLMLFSMMLLTLGSGLNMFSSPLSGPQQFMVGQIMIGFASGMFFPTMQTMAMTKANAYGTTGLMTYLIFFLSSQLGGGLLDSGVFNTWVDYRENFHYAMLNGEMVASRPEVAHVLQSYATAASAITSDVTLQNAAAVDALSQQTKTQATLMANNDMFVAITLFGVFFTAVFFVAFILVPIFKKKRRRN